MKLPLIFLSASVILATSVAMADDTLRIRQSDSYSTDTYTSEPNTQVTIERRTEPYTGERYSETRRYDDIFSRRMYNRDEVPDPGQEGRDLSMGYESNGGIEDRYEYGSNDHDSPYRARTEVRRHS